MQELRFVAVSEDGSYAVLAVPGRSGRYILPIDERLRAVAQGQTSRLAQYEIEVESPLRPKEIQARIRAGETAEEIADAAGIPVERVRWFEGPVLAERAYIAEQAQVGSVRRAGDSSGPGPRLGEIVTVRLSASGTDPADGQWDSRKRGDGNWQVSLTFPSGGRLHVAEWVFDPRRRHVMPDDDNAARLSLPESELPEEPVAVPGEATVTPIASRLGAAAGMGGGFAGGPSVSRFRPERSVIPDRSLGADRSLADRPVIDRPLPAPAPAAERQAMPERAAAPDRPAMSHNPAASPVLPRPAQQDRPGYQSRPASHDYVEFPESPPYRVPEPAAEPPAHHEQAAYREAAPEPRDYRDPAPEPRDRREPAAPAPVYRAQETGTPGYRAPAPDQALSGRTAPAPTPSRAPQEPAAPAVPVPAGPAFDEAERTRATPPRPVVFEDTQPSFADEQPGAAQAFAPAASEPAAASPADAPPAAEPAVSAEPPRTEAAAHNDPAPAAAGTAPTSTAAEPAAAGGAPTSAAGPAAAAAPVADEPAARATATEPEVSPAASGSAPAAPASAAPATAEQETGEPPAADQPAAPAAAEPETEVPAAAETPAAEGPAAETPAAEDPAAEDPAAEDQASRARAGAKKNAKGRRSSVPSWDEIMLGSSRQRE